MALLTVMQSDGLPDKIKISPYVKTLVIHEENVHYFNESLNM